MRRTQRAQRWRRVLTSPEPSRTLFGVLSCLPTAPALPKVTNENFGTFSFRRQLSGNYCLPVVIDLGSLDIKHNSKSEIKFSVDQLAGPPREQ